MDRVIKFCYRKIIDNTSSKAWERLVHEDSYAEFKMQSQRFNAAGKYNTFSDILLNDANAAQLHFLVSGAIIPYIKHLEEKIPDVLNTLGKHFLPFKNFRFEIINSDINNSSKHIIAINFFSEPVTWIDTIGSILLVSVNNNQENSGTAYRHFCYAAFYEYLFCAAIKYFMEQQAKIFLSEERGLTQLDWLRSYHTFNFGAYQTAYKTAVGNLYVLNDDTLAGEKSISMKVEEDTLLLLLPIAGAVEYRDSNSNNNIVIAGQVLTTGVEANSSFTFTNPYPEALVNFLHAWIKAPGIQYATGIREHSFDINATKNIVVKKELAAGISLHIGKFDGRKKATVDFNNANGTVFAFVVEGAFELEERLLHARDGLALWNLPQAEMEALSNDAIILFIEMN